jgi:hypothetical protein
MPWTPELFTAPAAAHIAEKARRERLLAIPYFEGLLSGDTDALIGSCRPSDRDRRRPH